MAVEEIKSNSSSNCFAIGFVMETTGTILVADHVLFSLLRSRVSCPIRDQLIPNLLCHKMFHCKPKLCHYTMCVKHFLRHIRLRFFI